MSKRFPIIAATLLLAASAMAVPAKRITRQVTQPDGTTLLVTMRGDENFHFTSTLDGKPLVKRTDGAYCYAKLSADGKSMVASTQLAHDEGQRGAAEISFLESSANDMQCVRLLGVERASRRNAARLERLARRGTTTMLPGKGAIPQPNYQITAGATGGEGIGVTGKRKGLVILVNFKDKKMQANHTREEFDRLFNEEGYSKNGNSGSVHDYFYNQSYGQFDLTFDVVGPVTVSKNMADYGANDSEGNDIDPAGMVYEACKLVDPEVNFADYDWDGDGRVDQVYLVYAGYGEASSADEDCIWQHEWEISDAGYSLVLDGTRINTYGCSSELYGNSGTTMDGIGTPCHEFSHCLGIPDLYDTSMSGYYGMNNWDLMDYGSYAGDGHKPIGYNTYEKWVSGWLQPTVLSEPCYVKDLKPLSEEPEAYVVFNEKTPTEYYILENRQLTGDDVELPAHGMLVIHVDYDQKAWFNNEVNNVKNHQRFTIVPADNKLSSSNNYADTYPGTTGNNQLTDTSTPAAKLFNANTDGRKFLGKPITDIYENTKGHISFTFMGGETLDVPTDLSTDGFTTSGFTASWSAVENADSYNVELREKTNQSSPDECLAITEDLSAWGSTLSQDGTKDLSSSLDDVMANKGWMGTKVFEGVGGAKLGSSKAAGNLTSPLLTATGNDVTVALMATRFNNDSPATTVALVDADGKELASSVVSLDGNVLYINLPNADEKDYRVSISPTKRCYVQSVAIYNGSFSSDDFDSASKVSALARQTYSKPSLAAQQFTDVKSTSYALAGLKPDGIYQWRVQAVNDNVVSGWSAWQTVDMTSQTSIKAVTDNGDIDTSTIVDVYTPAGIHVATKTYADFLADKTLRGIYVVQHDGGAIIIRK